MQTYIATPSVCKSACRAPTSCRPESNFFSKSSSSDLLVPLFRLLSTPRGPTTSAPSRRSHRRGNHILSPRFDVREGSTAFELQGELAGFRQDDVAIEFVDANTLVIRGTKDRVTLEADVSANKGKEPEAESPATLIQKDVDSDEDSSYHKATVEDEDADGDFVDAGAEFSEGEAPTFTTAATTHQPVFEAAAKDNKNEFTSGEDKREKARYLISERATGQFERRFKFPGLVDRDVVKASLKNGILSIVVPKVERKETRIVVE